MALVRRGVEVEVGAPGCDDAPLITVPHGSAPKKFTMIYPYYENPEFLDKQIKNWAKYPKLLRHMMKVIVVDDGSPRNPAENVVVRWPYSFIRLFRIEVDVRWNWLAARNIGAHHADDGWLLLTDMDHVVDSKCLFDVIYGVHDPGTIYRFSRREHDGKKIHPHPNSWLMTRDTYWKKIGGYDESCSGYYGTDGDYRRRCAAAAPIRIMSTELERHEYQGDSSTTSYKRKQPEDAAVKQMIRARPKRGWRPRVLSFPYKEVRLP